MKKILFIISLCAIGLAGNSQTLNPFPTTDSLRKFINKWIRNSAIDAFTNLRLNTSLIGMSRFLDSAYGGQVTAFTYSTDTLRLTLLSGQVLKVALPSATGNSNLGAGFRLIVPSSQGVKTIFAGNTVLIDSSSNANGITFKVDTTVIATLYDITLKANQQAFIDSIAALRTAIGSGGTPPGTNEQVIFNDGGVFGADAGLTYDAILNKVTTDSLAAKKIVYDSSRVSNTPFKPYINAFNAFGNSVTVGYGINYPDSTYIARIADTLLVPYNNYAISGSGVRAAITQAHKYVSGTLNNIATFIMPGYNDIRAAGGGITDKTYNKVINGTKAVFVAHYADGYTEASASGILRYGAWTLYQNATIYGGKTNRAAVTTTLNDSLKWVFVGQTVAVVLLGGDSTNFNSSIVEVLIDGVSQGEYNTNNQTDGINISPYGNDYRIPYPIIISGLAPGTHTLKLVNKAARSMYVDYLTTLSPNKAQFVVFDPIQYSSAAQVAVLNSKLDSLVLALPSGFSVLKVTTNSVFNPATGGHVDGVHLNVTGNSQVLKAFRNAHDSTILASEGTVFRTEGAKYLVNRTYKQIPNSGDVWTKSEGNLKAENVTIPYWGSYMQGYTPILTTDSANAVVRVGPGALGKLTTGSFTTAIGANALANATTAGNNTAVGSYVLYNATGTSNTGIGQSVLFANTTGSSNIGMGVFALRNNLGGNSNIAIGSSPLFNNTSGSFNTAIGDQALNANVGQFYNVAFGANAGRLSTGANNIYIGSNAGQNQTAGSNNLALCFQCDFPSLTTGNQLNIAASIFGTATGTATGQSISTGAKIGIINNAPAVTLHIGGTDAVGINGGTTAQRPTGAAGYVRWNTDSTRFEGYTGAKWVSLLPGDAPIGMGNPMTTAGDLITGGVSGAPTRLALGSAGSIVTSNGTGIEYTSASSLFPVATYTPTLTNTANITGSTAYTTYYQRIGNKVEVWGKLDLDPVAATTETEIGISLPVASSFANDMSLSGTGACGGNNSTAGIEADVSNSRAKLIMYPTADGLFTVRFHFSYYYTAP